MAQFARPDSTVSAGLWEPQGGPSTLWECLDETSASDTDYIEALNGENTTCELGLSTVTDPVSSTGHVIRFRMQGTGSGGPERCAVQLWDGGTQIATTGNQTSRGAWGDKSYTLSAAEADSIGDYSDLRLKIISSNLGGSEDMWASWAEFEVPDAPPPPSGAGAQTFGALTQAGTGSLPPSGVGAQTFAALAMGATALSGLVVGTISEAALSEVPISGSVEKPPAGPSPVSGTGASRFQALSSSAAGGMAPAGLGSSVLAAPRQAGSGGERFTGPGASRLAALATSGIAVMAPEGLGAQAFEPLAQSGNGAERFVGSAATLLEAPAQAGSGAATVPGAGSSRFAAPRQAAVGVMPPAGAANSVFAALVQSAAGVQVFIGDGASVLQALVQDGGGLLVPAGLGAQRFAELRQAGAGSSLEGFTGAGSSRFAGLRQAAVGVMPPVGAATSVFAAVVQSAAGVQVFIGDAASAFEALVQDGGGLLVPAGLGVQRFAELRQAGAGSSLEGFTGAGSSRFAGLLQDAVGVMPPVGAGASVFVALVQSGSGAVIFAGARVTQAPNLALAEGGGLRVTQGPALALLQQTLDELRVTGAPALVLAAEVPCATHWCQTWRIARLDGTVFRYTDHNEIVPFQGQSFSPCNSLSASAAELAAFIGQIGSQDLAGIIADDGISEADLYNGLFDGAILEVWLVPWSQAGGQIPRRLFYGTVEGTSQGQHGFKAEVSTPGAKLQQRALLKHYTASCRWTFGDASCAVDLGPLTVTGSVTQRAAIGAANRARNRIFRDSSRAEAAGTFDQGLLSWTGGNNAGKSSPVKSQAADGSFTLWDPLLFEIEIGDAYSVYEGCDKTETRCKELLNFDRYGGFPHVSGRDKISQTPDSK